LTDEQHHAAFVDRYGRDPVVRACAPGRVNLIGEHTDYNGGFVLPMITAQDTRVLMAPRDDRRVRLWSANVEATESAAEYELGGERASNGWVDYVAGVTAVLRKSVDALVGFDATITSTLPLGGGLSSSASLEVAVLRALNELFALSLDASAIARLAHQVETEFVGVPVGVMDQMAVSLGSPNAALFIDTRSLERASLPLPPATALLILDSGIPHGHATGEYRVRREECATAARELGVASLRDATLQQLESSGLRDPLRKRARHVISENQRVLDAADALRQGRAAEFGALMNASHESLRVDFEVSVPDVDRLVALAQSQHGVFGARMTGGGFGGAIVGLADASNARGVAERVAADYNAGGRYRATVLAP
jgi:galactokinase